jgi:hypothetical protein
MINKILIGALGVLVLAGIILFFVQRSSISKRDANIANLQKELYACQNTLPHIDTFYSTIVIKDPTHSHPKPNDNQGVQKPKDSTKCNPTGVFYSENYEKEGIKIHWQASTMLKKDSCIIDYIAFPEIVYPKELVIKTVTVIDTVDKEVPAKIKSKFVAYGGLWTDNFKYFPGVELGIGYLRKNNWFIIGGAMYLDQRFYGTIKVGITF